jgi:hypothetical protein
MEHVLQLGQYFTSAYLTPTKQFMFLFFPFYNEMLNNFGEERG